MDKESFQDDTAVKQCASRLLPPLHPAGTGRWTIRIVAWLGVIALYVLTLTYDVSLMHWRYNVMPEGPRGIFKQVLFGFRDFGQILPLVITVIIIARLDRRRWTIVPAILIAQLIAILAYDTGKLTIARYRPQPAIQQILTISQTSVPESEKNDYALSNMDVRDTWIGYRPFNAKSDTQSFPSGHSAAAFALAGVLVWFYPKLTITFWTLAIGCVVSRYLDAVHWLSDCVAGASIGYIASWLSLRLMSVAYSRKLAAH